MSDEVLYDPLTVTLYPPRWASQASQMRTAANQLDEASTSDLPSTAQSAATAFLSTWAQRARKGSVASDVYADELRSVHGSYLNFDAEIARRMEALKP